MLRSQCPACGKLFWRKCSNCNPETAKDTSSPGWRKGPKCAGDKRGDDGSET